ncbi:thiol:disulfide interchange protein DsbA/DsbL [Luteimonas sp. 100069]|uniref:thiol:disulfide interchange protein DsbA/DsbL n=1 Tax=Luteimonas sp. 100069 TaxID=2006109 RepID=UPI000F509E75|nr:thiol:disulfide interchange protein DsbA/DsbL [Luteimonas sp. 100069]RPD85107.1 thiol:disulfide interchange protein DsbA/DsbL [Luteimonas sp. 100069]
MSAFPTFNWRPLVLLALLLGAWLPATAQPHAPLEGRDYALIADGQPWQPLDGRIEVVEVFSYGCVHCFRFQKLLDAWRAKAPADVRLTYVPAAFSAGDNFARGFFVAQDQGLDARSHHALFSAVHDTGALPRSGASPEAIAAFYVGQGARSQARFAAAMASPATDEKLNAARAFATRSGVEGTPTLIINGRYRVMGRSLEELLTVTDQLIARERAAR